MNTKIIIGILSAALLLLGGLFLFALGYHMGANSVSLISQTGQPGHGPQVQFRQNNVSSPAPANQNGEPAATFKQDPNEKKEVETARKNLDALENAVLNQ